MRGVDDGTNLQHREPLASTAVLAHSITLIAAVRAVLGPEEKPTARCDRVLGEASAAAEMSHHQGRQASRSGMSALRAVPVASVCGIVQHHMTGALSSGASEKHAYRRRGKEGAVVRLRAMVAGGKLTCRWSGEAIDAVPTPSCFPAQDTVRVGRLLRTAGPSNSLLSTVNSFPGAGGECRQTICCTVAVAQVR
ncbi:hypothetical protein BV20DRAFT_446558 [Pilatotrama ljubarskyi]|nr:hypothetical protein BV20DRAFT_535187 [Pilatotrama ljubarskyi]KAI0368582.1 hypothetical protein BV20DRAFT_446558 [Pilatotrama ljubarskyi]